TPNWNLSELWKEVDSARRAGLPQRRVVRCGVAGYVAQENVDRIGAQASQPVQLELDKDRVADLLRVGLQTLRRDAADPAPSIITEADHTLQRFGVDQRIVPASDHRPVARQRPLARKVDLLELRDLAGGVDVLEDVAVEHVEHLARGRLIPSA